MIALAFYQAEQGNALDRMIDLWTGNDGFSHVELVIGETMYSSSHRDGGVREKEHAQDPDKWEYIPITNTVDIDCIEAFYGATVESPYALRDLLLLQVLGLGVNSREKWFCSEWVIQALQYGQWDQLIGLNPSLVSPNGLYRHLKRLHV